MSNGIRMIRDSVTRFGILSGITRCASHACVKVAVDALGERTADSGDLGDVVDRGGLHPAQAAEVLDQRLAPLGPDAGDLVQHRGGARFPATSAMSDDREAMCFVANLLDEVKTGMRRRELKASLFRLENQLFHAGLAFRPLCDADDARLVQAEVR